MARYAISRETWLHSFRWLATSYLSNLHFKQLAYRYTTKCIIGMIFVTSFIFKLDFYGTLCHTFLKLIVYNYISHLGRKLSPGAGYFVMELWHWNFMITYKQIDYFLPEKHCSLKETRYSKIPFLIIGDQIY